jgi:hypothetical protein
MVIPPAVLLLFMIALDMLIIFCNFSVCVWVYVCESVCVCVCVRERERERERERVCLCVYIFGTFHLVFQSLILGPGLLSKLEWLASELQRTALLCHPNAGL